MLDQKGYNKKLLNIIQKINFKININRQIKNYQCYAKNHFDFNYANDSVTTISKIITTEIQF